MVCFLASAGLLLGTDRHLLRIDAHFELRNIRCGTRTSKTLAAWTAILPAPGRDLIRRAWIGAGRVYSVLVQLAPAAQDRSSPKVG